jgi:hypothetical protein
MLRIALIDDRKFGMHQIREIHDGENICLEYFETFKSFKESGKVFDVAYLDFHLKKDKITSDTVLDEVKEQARKVVGFSVNPMKSEKLKKLGADEAIWKRPSLH